MMEVSNHLGETLTTAGEMARYDANAKELLSDKIIIAEIVKRLFPEFKDISKADIPSYIDGTPKVGQIAVAPDQTNPSLGKLEPGAIRGASQENTSSTEGKITFDVFFKMQLPKGIGETDVYINIEAQNSENVDYPLERRAAYYVARIVSSENQRDFAHAEYDKIKKAYSIWVIVNPEPEKQNTISSYQMHQEMIFGNLPDNHKYDIMQIFMIRLGQDYDNKQIDRLVRLLTTVFSTKLRGDDKKRILKDEFDMKVNDTIERNVNDMCNLSQGIVDEAKKEAKEETMAECAIGMKKAGATDEFIAQSLSLTTTEAQALLKKYQESTKA